MENLSHNNKDTVKELDILVKAAGLIGSISILVSIIYDWGYYHALGLSFNELPTSLADHVRSSLLWLPKVFFSAFAIFIIEMMLRRLERGMSEEEIVASSKYPKLTRVFRASPYIFVFIYSIYIFVEYVFFGKGEAQEVIGSSIIIWFSFVMWVYHHPRIKEKTTFFVRRLVYWVPPAVLLIGSYGYTDAINNIKKSNIQTIVLKSGLNKSIEVRTLRTFDKGLLVSEATGSRIMIIPMDNVLNIQSKFVQVEKIKSNGAMK